MPRSLMRLSTRHLMIIVAAGALVLTCWRSWPAVRDFFQEDPFHSFRNTKKTWDLGPAPSIFVDVFEGGITVEPSHDQLTTAEISSHTRTKRNQATTDDAIRSIEVSCDQDRDSLRIVVRGASEPGIFKETSVRLSVPDGVDLDLRTGRGMIYVGKNFGIGGGFSAAHAPVVASSIRARNDSKYQFAYAEGGLYVECKAPLDAVGAPIPTRLQLDAPGHIDIIADLARVEARSWHGNSPVEWGPNYHSYNEYHEGVISFDGELAPGPNSFRAAHRVDLKLPESSLIQGDAEALNGIIMGDLLPYGGRPSKDRASWQPIIGSNAFVQVKLKADDGTISLNKRR